MIIDNPYTVPLQEARKAEDERLEKELFDKWSVYTSEQLSQLSAVLNRVEGDVSELPEVITPLSWSKQYEASCQLYYRVRDLLLEVRKLKKHIREVRK